MQGHLQRRRSTAAVCLLFLVAGCELSDTPPLGPAGARPELAVASSSLRLPLNTTPGASTFGRHEYVSAYTGTLPIIFLVPHGGGLTPSEIPDRLPAGTILPEGRVVTDTDWSTNELATTLSDRLHDSTGARPYVIRMFLKPTKVDANRDSVREMRLVHDRRDPEALRAWSEYHSLADQAEADCRAKFGRCFVIDIHGHGRPVQQLEIGYLPGAMAYQQTNAQLDADASLRSRTSLATWSSTATLSLASLLRGSKSFGTYMENAGVAATPSVQRPRPDTRSYVSGGYSVRRHMCWDRGPHCGLQIEHNSDVRRAGAPRDRYTRTFPGVFRRYVAQFGIDLPVKR
jgi:N-formylglutamate amidohydrolase